MHQMFILTTTKQADESSLDARKRVLYRFDDYAPSFSVDWFVIGGRFSGELSRWHGKEVGQRTFAFYEELGNEDDAQILDEKILEELDWFRQNDYHFDLEGDDPSPDFIGKKWAVVIDAHV